MNLNINSIAKEDYSDKYDDHVFEQYKLYLEMTDRISSRRQAANTFFLSLNTALVALTGYAKSSIDTSFFYYLLTSFSGVILCYVWYRLVLSYKNLNSAKFKVIHVIEDKLPLKLYKAEWDAVGQGKDKKLYHPFTNLEMCIPWIFAGIYLMVIVYFMPWTYIFGVVHTMICG